MTRLLAVVLLATTLLPGCQTVVGPVQRSRTPSRPVDDLCLSIDEQQARGRARLGNPDQTLQLGPRTYAEIPNSIGR